MHSNNSMQLTLPFEDVSDGRRKSKSIPRGASVNVRDSTTILLEDIDQFQSDIRNSVIKTSNNSRESNASSIYGYVTNSGNNSSFEETRKKLSMSDIIPYQNQIRGRLTLPHLDTYQTKSLDIPSSQSGSPNLLHAESEVIVDSRKKQIKNIDISPVSATGAGKIMKPSRPMPSISIHVRKPTVKSSVHGKLKLYMHHQHSNLGLGII